MKKKSYYAKISIIGSDCEFLAIGEKAELYAKKIGEIHKNEYVEVNPVSTVFHWTKMWDPMKKIVRKHDIFFYKLIGQSGWIHDFNRFNPDSRTITIVGEKVTFFPTI